MRIRWIFLLALMMSLVSPGAAQAQAQAGPARISNLRVLTPRVALFDHVEARFDLRTQAAYPNLPYDPQPPAGLEVVSGVSADAVLTGPDGRKFTQPAFYYQPYRNTPVNGEDHRVPDGQPYWMVRFTPQQTGTWEMRIRAVDSGGLALSAPARFTVSGSSQNPYRARGFVRVSQKDPRYFEFSDGSMFHGAGFNDGLDDATLAAARMAEFRQNQINFIRAWMSSSGINGSQWTPWSSFHLSFDAYLPPTSFDTTVTYAGHDLSYRLDSTNSCLFQGWLSGPVAVEPNTAYEIRARVKVADAAGGFVIKTGGWMQQTCSQPGQGIPLTQPLTGSSDWTEVTGRLQTGGQQFLDFFYLTLQDGRGQAWIDEVRLYRADDPNQVNLLPDGSADAHLIYDQAAAHRWDGIINAAEENGVYLKLVIDEKNEWIRDHIDAQGEFTAEGDNANFYAAPGTKVRWLQQAWWRYVIARWGYSPAIHSFEYVNEGDPYNGNHYEAANSMAAYIHRWDPARHLVTTSFWHSFPNVEFWSNPHYSDIDYADLHAYLTTGWNDQNAAFLSGFALETETKNTRAGLPAVRIDARQEDSASITPRGLVLRENGEWMVRYWMKAENFRADCPYNTTGSMARLRWRLDGGPSNGGKEMVVPTTQEGKDFICTAPDGTYDWREFRSDTDRDGNKLAEQFRLFITDDRPHEISLSIENSAGRQGSAWISQVELISPSGVVTPVIGTFDTTRFDEDSAWYNAAYGLLLGAGSPVGAGKPLIRGEGGFDSAETGGYWEEINRDQAGIWLHNNLWAQLGPGGMIDLMWWASETISENQNTGRVPGLYPVFRTYQRFVEDIPLNNGQYRDARAQVSDPVLRAWGQRDDLAGRAHLWIQNRQHTWRAAVAGTQIKPVQGQVLLPDMAPGMYAVEWWDTYAAENPVIKTEIISSNGGMLILSLPTALTGDIAVKVTRK